MSVFLCFVFVLDLLLSCLLLLVVVPVVLYILPLSVLLPFLHMFIHDNIAGAAGETLPTQVFL